MPLFEVAFLTRNAEGKEEVEGPITVLALNEKAAIAVASWEADEDCARGEAEVVVRPFK